MDHRQPRRRRWRRTGRPIDYYRNLQVLVGDVSLLFSSRANVRHH
uniref:Uncharacterized protein n=1 Tax=Ascaris lumbricoides TaxID=6252 RepID=A0A0M3I8U8_ASCLU